MNNVIVAKRCWPTPPDWIMALAELCDKSSQNKAAAEIGYSNAVISQAIQNKYPGDMKKIEQAVRGALLQQTVDCPVLGDIASHTCIQYQRQKFAATNSMRVRLYRACRNGCEHYKAQAS